MGFNLIYKSQNREINFNLSSLDIDILSTLQKNGLEYEVDLVIGASDFGTEDSIERKSLLNSAIAINDTIEEREDVVPCTYLIELYIETVNGKAKSSGAGGVCGLEIDGERYGLESGLGFCNLVRYKQVGESIWEVAETTDIRDRTSIQTTNLGEIKIKKREKATDLKKKIQKLINFLRKEPDTDIIKILC